MKWLTKDSHIRPVEGQQRSRTIMAIKPRKCVDGYTRWLEFVVVYERFVVDDSRDGILRYWEEWKVRGALED